MKRIEFDVEVYTFQIDFAGHVSNIVYIQWMEIGRIKLLEALGLPVPEMMAQGIAPILASTTIEYRVPILLGDPVRIHLWIPNLRRASAEIAFEFWKDAETLAATGRQRALFVDRSTGRPVRLNAAQRAAFDQFVGREAV